ncbi:MAG: Firmicutes ribosomal L7Ae family protein [Evtepia sp.]|jgi:large subunit ribosomal protein L7A|nr:Firmicutes ribosomal L7Ae family protein [Evtepia sp.]
MLETLRSKPSDKRAVGAKQVGRALRNGEVLCVFLAEDADPKVTEPIEILCKNQSVSVEKVSSMSELGKACGIAVGSSVAAIVE